MNPDSDKKNTKEISNAPSTALGNDFDTSLLTSKDKNFVFTHQKVKKLAAAVYMITNFFDDQEPIKWSLRALSTSLLKKNIALTDKIFANSFATHESVRETILETVSLLEVASFAGLVSSMNVEILKKEFAELLKRMDSIVNPSSSSASSVAEQFFAVAPTLKNERESVPTSAPVIPQKTQDQTLHVKDNSTVLYNADTNTAEDAEVAIDSRVNLRDFSPVAVKKNKRQSAIINLLKRKKEIMIKDVVGIITDCSEKTIQRELLALVDEGILRKEGERRWTRYSLV